MKILIAILLLAATLSACEETPDPFACLATASCPSSEGFAGSPGSDDLDAGM